MNLKPLLNKPKKTFFSYIKTFVFYNKSKYTPTPIREILMKIRQLNRIYHNSTLKENNNLILEKESFHYLINVIRIKKDEFIKIFNENDGEYIAKIEKIDKNKVILNIQNRISNPYNKNRTLSLTLAMSLIKNDRFLDAIDMSVQIGVDKIIPIITEYTQVRSLNIQRTYKRIIEATEQSNRLCPPILLEPINLNKLLAYNDNLILYANEYEKSQNIIKLDKEENIILLIGPEGGFSNSEIKWLEIQNNFHSISLGSNILRSETAAIVGLAKIFNLTE